MENQSAAYLHVTPLTSPRRVNSLATLAWYRDAHIRTLLECTIGCRMDISQPTLGAGATTFSSSLSAPLGPVSFLPSINSYASATVEGSQTPNARDSRSGSPERAQQGLHNDANPSEATPRDDETRSHDGSVETVRYADSLIGAALPGRRAKSKVRKWLIFLGRTELHFPSCFHELSRLLSACCARIQATEVRY